MAWERSHEQNLKLPLIHCLMCSVERFVYITGDLAQKELVSFLSVLLEGHASPPPAAPKERTWISIPIQCDEGLMQPVLEPSFSIPYFPLRFLSCKYRLCTAMHRHQLLLRLFNE